MTCLEIIYNEIVVFFGAINENVPFLENANAILSYSMTLIYYLAFALLPLIVVFWFVGLFSPIRERKGKKRYKDYYY